MNIIASLTYSYIAGNQSFEAQAFASRYHFLLYSDFTFFLDNPIQGDMIRQRDDRTILGFNTKYVWTNEKNKLTVGGGIRYDDIDNQLAKAPQRKLLAVVADANAREAATHIYER